MCIDDMEPNKMREPPTIRSNVLNTKGRVETTEEPSKHFCHRKNGCLGYPELCKICRHDATKPSCFVEAQDYEGYMLGTNRTPEPELVAEERKLNAETKARWLKKFGVEMRK